MAYAPSVLRENCPEGRVHLVDGQGAGRRLQEMGTAAFLELGFSEKLVDPAFDEEPQFDFGFYGLNVTPHRREMLERLKDRCAIAMPDRFLLGRELNKFIASAKVGICLKHL